MKQFGGWLGAAVLAALVWAPVQAQSPSTGGQAGPSAKEPAGMQKPSATAQLKNSEGKVVGDAQLRQTPHGVWIKAELKGVSPGVHAFHIHETGRCEPTSFESAGGHFAPGKNPHGVLNPKGPHAGDFLNIHVPQSGQLTFEVVADDVTLEAGERSLFDQDGSALMVHAKADDYESQPSGAAGDRIACGVIDRAK